MKKNVTLILFSFIINSIYGQQGVVNKVYKGSFATIESDKDINGNTWTGLAEYEYYPNPDESRVFNGRFHFSYNNIVIVGNFSQDRKNGEWKYSKSYKETPFTISKSLTGNYVNGDMEGEWVYVIEKKKDGKLISVNKSVAHFHNNNFVGDLIYNDPNKSLYGKANNEGLFDSTWILKSRKNNIDYITELKFLKGVPYFIKKTNLSNGNIDFNIDSSKFINNFFNRYDTSNYILKIGDHLYGNDVFKVIAGDCKNYLLNSYRLEICSVYTSVREESYPSEGFLKYDSNNKLLLRKGNIVDFADDNLIKINTSNFEDIFSELTFWTSVHNGNIFGITKGNNASFVFPLSSIHILW